MRLLVFATVMLARSASADVIDLDYATISQLRDFLAAPHKDDGDRVIIANTRLGELLLHASCPVPEIDGACVKTVNVARGAACSSTTTKLAVVARDPRGKRAAYEAFATAASEMEMHRGGHDARAAYARAKLALATRDYEAYLTLALPPTPDFNKPRFVNWLDEPRFANWFKVKTAAATALRDRLAAIVALHDPATTIAADAFAGQIAQTMAEAIAGAQIPERIRGTNDIVDALCDAMVVAAAPHFDEARDAFRACLAKASELSWFDDSAKLCERALGRIDPETFPTASELRPVPDQVAPILDVSE